MMIDFHQQYKEYSNAELLKIISRPEDYQAEAVTAASEILSRRNISPEDIQMTNQHLLDLDHAAKADQQKLNFLKDKATDLFEPVLFPGEKLEPSKWVNLLLFVIALQYAWYLFDTIKRSLIFFRGEPGYGDVFYFTEYMPALYIPVIFYLVLKRRRWGWILLFADNLFSLISGLSAIYYFFRYLEITHANPVTFFWSLSVRAVFAYFLWRDVISQHFGIDHSTKKKTVYFTISGTALFMLLTYAIYS